MSNLIPRRNTFCCSACNGELKQYGDATQVYECQSCGGLQGTTYDGLINQYVKVGTLKDGCEDGSALYFDFTILSGKDGSVRRVHGWFDPKDRQVVQYG